MDEMRKIKEKYVEDVKAYARESKKFSNWRLVIFLLIVGVGLANFKNLLHFPYIVIEILLVAIFIFVVIKEGNADRNQRRGENLVAIIENYEKRENGQWKEFSENGIEFLENYSYLLDLQILGENSLYQFLNCAQTIGGKKKLAKKLKVIMEESPKSIVEDAKIYQEAIGELVKDPKLILDFQEKISEIEGARKMEAETEKDAFEMKRKFSKVDFVISLILSAITIGCAVMAKFNINYLLALIPMIFIQFVSAIVYQNAFNKELSLTGKHVKKLKELQQVCLLFENKKFNSDKLNQLSNQLAACTEVFKKMKKIDALESFRRNFLMWFIGNIFLSLNRFIVRQYGKIEREDKAKLYDSLVAIEEIEVLISLGTINLVKRVNCQPVFSEENRLDAKNIKHPMLVEENCVANDFSSGRNINIITGSNMSGKTSFMKTIGVNLVLAYSGAYVNSDCFVAPIGKIYTSINVKDDINKGISKFYAELLRLKDAIDGADLGERMVLFVDEIFSGTNYQDRIYGAKNIIKRLAKEDVMGFITTHDFELCEINSHGEAQISNYHFSEEYIHGKMHFSHKIQKGKCNGTNAVELMRQAGVLSKENME